MMSSPVGLRRVLYGLSIEAAAGVRYAGVSATIMLKIGSVRWRGKCAKHPGFDPAMDGPGAIKGNCQRCNDLMVIHDLHQKALRMMRTFKPTEEKRIAPRPGTGDDRQLGLFA
jgi:hypothetical protein